jgi:hypothetical protein
MFIPFLAAAAVAAAFAQVGAMSVKIAFLTSALNAMVLIAIALVVFACCCRPTFDPGCRFSVTQRDVPGIVAGCGMAEYRGGSVKSRRSGSKSSRRQK